MESTDYSFFAPALINWYEQHKRDLPWRETADPYPIWLSEVILQQTRVSQGLPYYQKFLAAYPAVQDLAAAPEEEVLRLWQGLGYYSRARNMHYTAKQLVNEYGGLFPRTCQELQKLRGVGSYTAAAIASFAYREKVAVLDGNVFRVLARVFGKTEDIAVPASKAVFRKLADSLIPAQAPDTFNQAIMEFGAIQCTPLMPDCLFCPLQQTCFAYNHGMVQELPVKSKAKAARPRFFHYIVFEHQGNYYLRKRLGGDIWQGLYDFYLYESTGKKLQAAFPAEELRQAGIPVSDDQVQAPLRKYKHVLSHQKITAEFYLVRLTAGLSEEIMQETRLAPFSAAAIDALPKPVLISSYLKDSRILVNL